MGDRYLQDDGRTLENKLGIVHDPKTLELKETLHVERRTMELRANGFPRAEGFDLVKAVHRHLFQDVYAWAGEPCEINLARAIYEERGSEVVQFTPANRIEAEGRQLFQDLTTAGALQGPPATREQLAEALPPFFGRLNTLHPFREGNGRTQRLVWEHLARQAGHELSFEGISRERMVAVSIAASSGDHDPARRMFSELLDPVRSAALRTATRFLEANRTAGFDWQDRYVATTEPGQDYRGVFVSAGGENFLMHDGKSLYIGQLTDLPEGGRRITAGDAVTFRAGAQSHAQLSPAPAKSALERLSVQSDEVAARLAAEHRVERAREQSERQREIEEQRRVEAERARDEGRQQASDRDKGLDLEP